MPENILKLSGAPFIGAQPGRIDALQGGAALFGAPHGTAYHGIDNRIHEATAAALRAAMQLDADFVAHWDYDFGGPLLGPGGYSLTDLGDLATTPLGTARNRALIEDTARAILRRNTVPIMIGGDDSTPIPFIAAFSDQPLTIVQIDAHIDWRDERYGEPMGYSSTMRRASEMAHVQHIVQVGMRGVGSARAAEVADAERWGAQIVTARQLHRDGLSQVLRHIPAGANCLITLDCDAIDGATMPAVSYPTPGGLSYTQIIELIAAVAAKARIAGFDLIEFVPGRDQTGYAAFVAGRILCNVVAQLARQA